MYTTFDWKRPYTTGDTATDVMTYGKRTLGSGSGLPFIVKIPFLQYTCNVQRCICMPILTSFLNCIVEIIALNKCASFWPEDLRVWDSEDP